MQVINVMTQKLDVVTKIVMVVPITGHHIRSTGWLHLPTSRGLSDGPIAHGTYHLTSRSLSDPPDRTINLPNF